MNGVCVCCNVHAMCGDVVCGVCGNVCVWHAWQSVCDVCGAVRMVWVALCSVTRVALCAGHVWHNTCMCGDVCIMSCYMSGVDQ